MKDWKLWLLGSLVFLCIPVFTSPELEKGWMMFRIPAFQHLFTYFVLLTVFFFLNYFLLLKLYFSYHKALYAVVLVGFYGLLLWVPPQVVLLIEILETKLGLIRDFPPDVPDIPNLAKLLPFMFVLVLSYLATLKRMLDEATNEKLKAEISYLKAQINPHFLFNTLNSIYALTIMKSDDAPKAVLGLSGLMRYVVNESSNDYVDLDTEISYLKNFIELQRLRVGNVTPIQVHIAGHFEGYRITPLVLIPIIENAFKYGVNPDKNSFIYIDIHCENSQFHMQVTNAKVNTQLDDIYRTGTGLPNITKRLEYFYPNRHALHISDTEMKYDVILNIQLT